MVKFTKRLADSRAPSSGSTGTRADEMAIIAAEATVRVDGTPVSHATVMNSAASAPRTAGPLHRTHALTASPRVRPVA